MPRHRNDTEIFRRLDFKGQAQSMNIACAQYRKKIDAHLELAQAEVEMPLPRSGRSHACVESSEITMEGSKISFGASSSSILATLGRGLAVDLMLSSTPGSS